LTGIIELSCALTAGEMLWCGGWVAVWGNGLLISSAADFGTNNDD